MTISKSVSAKNYIDILTGIIYTGGMEEILYGAYREDVQDDVYPLEGLDFKQARDLCEFGGAQLMKKVGDKDWEEA